MNINCSQPDDLGIWRFGIISPLLHHDSNGIPLHAQICNLTEKHFVTPDGRQKKLSADTIRYWLDRYRAGGIDALRNKPRIDQGKTSVPMQMRVKLAALRQEHPQWTIIRLLREMIKTGDWNGTKPSRCSIYRYAKKNALNALPVNKSTSVKMFEYPFFGDMWISDFLHGPKVRNGVHMQKAYLCAIIDDATRYVVAAKFHLSEGTESLLDDFMLAIRRFGVPKRLYTDNGSAFRSNHLQLVAARLGIALPHTPPYTPQGRGKIERFFRTVRDGYLNGMSPMTLNELNLKFNVWLQEYHKTIHSTLEMSPLNRKSIDKGAPLKQIPPTMNIDEYFLLEHNCKIASDGCVRLFNKRFEIPDSIVGTKVCIYYLPWNKEYVMIGPEKKIVKPLDTIKNALRFDKPQRGLSNNNDINTCNGTTSKENNHGTK